MDKQHIIKGELITHTLKGGITIQARESDGYCFATGMCQAAGKKWHDFYRLEEVQKYIAVTKKKREFPLLNLSTL